MIFVHGMREIWSRRTFALIWYTNPHSPTHHPFISSCKAAATKRRVEELAAAAAKRKEEEAKSGAAKPSQEEEKVSDKKTKVEELAAAANKRKEEEQQKAAAEKSPLSGGLLEKSPGKSAAEDEDKEKDEKNAFRQQLFADEKVG